jgi:hypothetical protein
LPSSIDRPWIAGGVLIVGGDGIVTGAVGISGDTSDNDEICAIAGIEAAGLAVKGEVQFLPPIMTTTVRRAGIAAPTI